LKLLSVDVCGLAVQVMDSGSQRTVVYLFEVLQPCLAYYEHVLQYRDLVDARQLFSSSFRVFNRNHPSPTKDKPGTPGHLEEGRRTAPCFAAHKDPAPCADVQPAVHNSSPQSIIHFGRLGFVSALARGE